MRTNRERNKAIPVGTNREQNIAMTLRKFNKKTCFRARKHLQVRKQAPICILSRGIVSRAAFAKGKQNVEECNAYARARARSRARAGSYRRFAGANRGVVECRKDTRNRGSCAARLACSQKRRAGCAFARRGVLRARRFSRRFRAKQALFRALFARRGRISAFGFRRR